MATMATLPDPRELTYSEHSPRGAHAQPAALGTMNGTSGLHPHAPPSPRALAGAQDLRGMLRLHIVDWGYADLPRGFYTLHGRTVYGRFVGDKPNHYWSVASLAPRAAAAGGGGGGGGGALPRPRPRPRPPRPTPCRPGTPCAPCASSPCSPLC